MLLKSQRNLFFAILLESGINPINATEQEGEEYYRIDIMVDEVDFLFCVFLDREDSFRIGINPGYSFGSDDFVVEKWEDVIDCFTVWAERIYDELKAPDLWAEATKTAQLFIPTSTPADDKFSRIELAEVQGQLRLLQQSFVTAALPEAARQKLIELTQTATVKAERLTKKDWQNWLIGGFISAIASLALNPTQASDVLKLVKAAFGGLFLH